MPLFTKFCTSQVVQDLFHQQYPTCMKRTFIFKNALVRDILVPRRVNQRNSEFDFCSLPTTSYKDKARKRRVRNDEYGMRVNMHKTPKLKIGTK